MVELREGVLINERFEVAEHIATGGFASVWKGFDRQLNRKVAIKRLLSTSLHDPKLKEEAISEARKIACVSHPNIVSIFDVVEHADEVLIVMEYLEGGTLHDLLRKHSVEGRWLCPVESFSLIHAILSGLNAAHSAENGPIIHRDLKPLNIMFDSRKVPKIADFGLASIGIVTAILTKHPGKWEHEGTLAYKSPEQLRGDQMDVRSDLFNVGLISYLLFVQFHPFIDPRFLFDYKEMVLQSYRPLLKLNTERLPPEFNDFLSSLLSVEPDGRFSTAAEALTEFEHFQGEYEKWLLDNSLSKYDFLNGNHLTDVDLSAIEMATGISLCKRNGFYAQGAFLYERSGVDFSELSTNEKEALENHYTFCRRRAGQEVIPNEG
jgi:eukaryotic-like serine/threonine-protein kinase